MGPVEIVAQRPSQAVDFGPFRNVPVHSDKRQKTKGTTPMKYILILLILLPLSAQADTYLCIAEKAADVTSNKGKIQKSEGYTADQKYLVDENGFRPFGQDVVTLGKCHYNDGEPTMCESDVDGWAGVFMLDQYNVFTYFAIDLRGDVTSHYVIKGKCSKL